MLSHLRFFIPPSHLCQPGALDLHYVNGQWFRLPLIPPRVQSSELQLRAQGHAKNFNHLPMWDVTRYLSWRNLSAVATERLGTVAVTVCCSREEAVGHKLAKNFEGRASFRSMQLKEIPYKLQRPSSFFFPARHAKIFLVSVLLPPFFHAQKKRLVSFLKIRQVIRE